MTHRHHTTDKAQMDSVHAQLAELRATVQRQARAVRRQRVMSVVLGCGVAAALTLGPVGAQVPSTILDVTEVTSVNGQPTVRFSNVNVQIVNGTGTTGGAPNGLGNLLVGYDVRPQDMGYRWTSAHGLQVGSYTGRTTAVVRPVSRWISRMYMWRKRTSTRSPNT